MISRVLILAVLAVSNILADFNHVVLEEIDTMPKGGGYATNLDAHAALASAVNVADTVTIRPEQARPGYCSRATYLLFLRTLEALQDNGRISLSRKTWDALVPRLRPDGSPRSPRWPSTSP